MKKRTPSILLSCALLLVAAGAVPLTAQIMQNPKAEPLRRIWTIEGNPVGGTYVGQSAGPVGDVNGDGLADFAVMTKGVWSVYYGGAPSPNYEPVWQFTGHSVPVIGHFWGPTSPTVAFRRDSVGPGANYVKLYFFRTKDDSLPMTPTTVLSTKTQPCGEFLAEDFDRDGFDDLLYAENCYGVNLWFYRGGPEFDVSAPTTIVEDDGGKLQSLSSFWWASGRLDDDEYIDLVTAAEYADGGTILKFYFGSEGSPWDWSTPDHVVSLNQWNSPRMGTSFHGLDCDGDGIRDLIIGNYLYRSGGGKSHRDRLFTVDDADALFELSGSVTAMLSSMGHVADSLKRYDAVAVGVPTASEQGTRLLLFGGGRNGPNLTYDAYYEPGTDGLLDRKLFGSRTTPIGDCNGDGWEDILASSSSYGISSDWKSGIALILSGGSYIPSDDPTVGVKSVPVAGIERGLHLWPNPVTGDKLNMAWRGDLQSMPERFAVHDVRGALITEGTVQPWKGSAWWVCEGIPPGLYLVTAYDGAGTALVSAQVVRQ